MKVMSFVLVVAMLFAMMAGCASGDKATPATSTDAAQTEQPAATDDAAAADSETAAPAASEGTINVAFIGNTTGDYAQYRCV